MPHNKRDWLFMTHGETHGFINHVWIYLNNQAIRTKFGFGAHEEHPSAGERSTPINASSWLEFTFQPKLIEYNACYIIWENIDTRTPVIQAQFLRLEKEIKALFRIFYNSFIKGNVYILEEDLRSMGFPVPSAPRSYVAPPSTVPEMEFHHTNRLVIMIHYHDTGANNPGRPDGAAYMELRYSVTTMDEPQALIEEFAGRINDTASPIKLTFNEPDLGKMFRCAGRWVSHRGEPGDWSDVYSTVIS
ncbi:MAG: hypothetical protein LBD21_01765 [Tannerellaceae bacterium]|jgi:hypothetical protein|nr:hypothetical protein [Tannerellaceae bacterium]